MKSTMLIYVFLIFLCIISSLTTICPGSKKWWKLTACPSKTLPRVEAYNSFNATNKFLCTMRSNGVDCMSVSFDVVTKTCYQFDKIGDDVGCSDMVDEPNTIYYYKDIECFNGGVQNTSTSCICTELTYGVNCSLFKARCEEEPYVVDNATMIDYISFNISARNFSIEGEIINYMYNCSEYYIADPPRFSVCQSNGTWSIPAECRERAICTDMYIVDHAYTWYPVIARNQFIEEDVIKYTCNIGYNISTTPSSVCQSNSTWSPPSPCRPVSSCEDIKICNSIYTTDGEYWVYPPAAGYQPVKIYCHMMSTPTPTDFITLHGNNEAIFPSRQQSGPTCFSRYKYIAQSGRTRFNKVRITSPTLQVIEDDFTFASTTSANGRHVKFGNAAACSLYNRCPGLGTMRIDITNTGLAFSNQTTYMYVPYGWAGKIDHVTRDTDHVITARCDGYCGGCRPDSNITFVLDPSYAPPVNDATVVSCNGN